MKLRILIAMIAILGGWRLVPAQTPGPVVAKPDAKPSTHQAKSATSQTAPDNEGEKKFKQNCSRCHNAPEDLSTRISGTVLLHMRVRASLSAADERAILRYLAP